MAAGYLEYPLGKEGYIDNWLVAGPLALPVPDLARFDGPDLPMQVVRHYHKDFFDLHEPPVEYGELEVDGSKVAWRYRRCADDHFVDLSGIYPTCHYLRAWAYSELIASAARPLTFALTVVGPADVWVNRQHVYRHQGMQGEPQRVSFGGELRAGPNEMLVRFETTAVRACPFVMAWQVMGDLPEHLTVRLPVDHVNVPRRQKLERIYQEAYVERTVILNSENVVLRWDDQLEEEGKVDFWLQDGRERIKSAGALDIKPSERISIGGRVLALAEGLYDIVLLPPAVVIERYGIRYRQCLPFHVLEHPCSEAPYGTTEGRRREGLEHAAGREGSLYAEIAKMALGRWGEVDHDLIKQAVEGVNGRRDGSVLDMLGLLGAVYRYAGSRMFLPEIKQAIQACALGFRYWHDEPDCDVVDYTAESRSLLFHACEILAGQLYPALTFGNAGQGGRWHREKGERLALDWLRGRGATGFSDWDGHSSFEEILLALSHLADLAESEEVRDLAAVMMDKVFLTMALNSYKGVFGSTHGCAAAPMIKGGRLEATSSLARLMWGMGVWNGQIKGLVGLTCSAYELPSIISTLAVDLSEETWSKERHGQVNQVTYRTPDYMLCSAQDYRPGEKGSQEHIWQATLGPDAVVFVNHPACLSEEDAQRPNFWRGNGVLPRVAQWKDLLVALYRLPAEDRLGFTHAYFPVHEFDEHRLEEGWAFARRGSGYLALGASTGLRLVTRGPGAFRELRTDGPETVWLCLAGREARDGSFEAFQEKVKGLRVEFSGLGVRCQTWRGQAVSFGWEGPLQVDGAAQPLGGFRHYDGPHCTADWPAAEIEARYGDYGLKLSFAG